MVIVGKKQETVKAEILALKKRGLIKAEEVHDWAEANPESALYGLLEWDNDVAARQWRIHQIRTYINLYVVDESGEPETISLSIERALPGGGYRIMEDVKNAPAMREILIGDLLTELERMAARHADLDELEPIWRAIRDMREILDKRARRRRGRREDARV